jgi:5-methyltetrahydropteroyltriglutamate--homocysteine methyltransferase
MKRSTERILTTHAGALARPDDLRDKLIAKDEGRPHDREAFDKRVRSAVAEVVQQQAACG